LRLGVLELERVPGTVVKSAQTKKKQLQLVDTNTSYECVGQKYKKKEKINNCKI